ncbi:MAG: hypothetical protein WC977_10750 [Anaerovoracaceae bacterium]
MPPTRNYDRDLIREIEQQGDWDAAIEDELDRLQTMPLAELADELTDAEAASVREYIIDTFGNRIATDRLHGRDY